MRTVLMMTQENPAGREYLRACLDAGVSLLALIVESSPFARRCLAYNQGRMGGYYVPPTTTQLLQGRTVPVHVCPAHRSAAVADLLRALSPDLVVAGGVGGILDREMLAIPRIGFVGCHPGLLPRMRGSNPVAHAILEDYPQGATCFLMDAGVDTGPIVCQEVLPVTPGWGYERIEAAMLQHCGRVLTAGLRLLLAGQRAFAPQQPEDGVNHRQASPTLIEEAREKLRQGLYPGAAAVR